MIDGITVDIAMRTFEIGSILIGGGMVAGGIRANNKTTKEGMALQAQRLEALEDEVKAFNKVITEVAVQNSRINFLEQRVEELRKVVAK